LTILTILISCLSATHKLDTSNDRYDYGQMIERYLKTKAIEPTVVFNNDGRKEFNLLNHIISWRELKKGVEITVNGQSIVTADKVTLNPVWGEEVDSVNFANYLNQIKIYEYDSLVGFVLTNSPCTGLGCGVNYQIVYDLKTKKQSYFGRFQTGLEFEIYNFNSDDRLDFLSKTFVGRNTQGIDTTEFVLYSQTEIGDFREFTAKDSTRFWFRHTYSVFQTDLDNDRFEEQWIEKINKNDR